MTRTVSTPPEQWTTLTARVLAPNPGPMTLDGTNTYLLRAPGSASMTVVDPGPNDAVHLDRIMDAGKVDLILLTHHHRDHVESAPELARRTGAPVRAWDPDLCIGGGPLQAREIIDTRVHIEVLHTPGHTADSVSFLLPNDTAIGAAGAARSGGEPRRAKADDEDQSFSGSILTGDTILGRGTTIIARPDGSLAAYLNSLEELAAIGAGRRVLPAHGQSLPDLAKAARRYLQHRRARLADVELALRELNLPASVAPDTVSAVTDRVYPHLASALRLAGEASALAHLEYLANH